MGISSYFAYNTCINCQCQWHSPTRQLGQSRFFFLNVTQASILLVSRRGRMVINESDEHERCEWPLSNQSRSFSLVVLEQLCECNSLGVLLKHKLRDVSNIHFETKCQEKIVTMKFLKPLFESRLFSVSVITVTAELFHF